MSSDDYRSCPYDMLLINIRKIDEQLWTVIVTAYDRNSDSVLYGEEQQYKNGSQALLNARALARMALHKAVAHQAQIYTNGEFTEVHDVDADDLKKRDGAPVEYRGWNFWFTGCWPATGLWRAESYGVTMCSRTLPGLRRMIDQRIRDYPGDGHGNTSRKL